MATTTYYTIQDRHQGVLQYVAQADSPMGALEAFDAAVGIDPHGDGLGIADWIIRPVTEDQARVLQEMDGTAQATIDYLEAVARPAA